MLGFIHKVAVGAGSYSMQGSHAVWSKQVEVAVKEAKEEDSDNESTEEAALRKSASESFERVSQEIEKASQEKPSARQAPPEQHARPDSTSAPAEQSVYSASQQPPGRQAGPPGAGHGPSSRAPTAERLYQSRSQRSPLKSLNRSELPGTQQTTKAYQDAKQNLSQPGRCAASGPFTLDLSQGSQLRAQKHNEQRQMPVGDRGHPQLLARSVSIAGNGSAGNPAVVRPPGLASAHGAPLQHSAARGTDHGRQPFADVQQQLMGRHAQPPSSHGYRAQPQLSQPVTQAPRPQSSALQQPQCLSGICGELSGSQQPNRISSNHSKEQSTGVFASKNSGIFADDDEGEEDADWDAGVAKLLESAALSRPPQQYSQPLMQVLSSEPQEYTWLHCMEAARSKSSLHACSIHTLPKPSDAVYLIGRMP